MKNLTQDQFLLKARIKHGFKYDYSKVVFKDTRTKICIICPEHGEFLQRPNAHLNGQGCPKCGRNMSTMKCTSNANDLIKRFREIHGDKYDYNISGYISVTSYINITCKKHNYIFKQRVTNHLRGSNCPICTNVGRRTYTTKEFCIKAREVHGDLYDYSEVKYVDKETPVAIVCKQHGIFYQKPHNHINGSGCPMCRAGKTQQKIYRFLCEKFPEEN